MTRFADMIPNAIMSPQLAQMMGARFAFGTKEDVDALIAQVTPEAEAQAKEQTAGSGLSGAARRWLGSGERGCSSNTIFTVLTGHDAMRGSGKSHPWDPADLIRCRLLLEWCSELEEQFPKMAHESKEWAGLVQNWDAICLTMDAEGPEWRQRRGSFPRTYNLIKQAIGRK